MVAVDAVGAVFLVKVGVEYWFKRILQKVAQDDGFELAGDFSGLPFFGADPWQVGLGWSGTLRPLGNACGACVGRGDGLRHGCGRLGMQV